MRELTQEEAERCAKCCGWLFVENKVLGYSFWIGKENKPRALSVDPLFWFSRLWETLKLKTPGKWEVAYSGKCSLIEDCLALCSAIVALEKGQEK